MKRNGLILVMLGAVLVAPVFAQDDEGEKPERGVARISVLSGDVSVKRGDSGDLVAAAINAPLVVQDRLITSGASRAEVQFDYANMIRLGPDTEIRLSELEYQRYQIQVALGTTTFRVLRDIKTDVEISTPSVSVRPLKKGVYRVTVREDGSSEITVRGGEADVFTPRGSERLGSGRTMLARGSASDPEFQVVAAIPVDDWDRWNDSRDRDLQRSRSYQYVSSDVYGADDLDSYGRWVNVAPYGYVWTPVVAADWAPYRAGRWVWVDWYGWSWVSYDPWGWAPYHYGRWFWNAPYGWCWWPGGFRRHYWSPALVAFFGWGSYGGFHAGIGWGWGNVGWIPLAPHDPFHRWWGRGYYGRGGVYNNVTIVNNTNITNVYRNARMVNAITSVEANRFGRGRISNADIVRVSGNDLARANLVRGQLPLAPGRESLAMSDRAVRTANLPRVNESRGFYSRRQPAPVERVSFERQRENVQEVARRSFGGGSGRGGDPAAVRGAQGTAPVVTGREAPRSETNGGWRRVGETAARGGGTASGGAVSGGGGGPAAEAARPAANDGWRRLGETTGRGPAVGESTSRGPAEQRTAEAPGGRTATDTTRSGAWHRFGEPSHTRVDGAAASGGGSTAPATMRSEPRDTGRSGGESGGFRRFGDTGSRQPATAEPSGNRGNSAPAVRSAPEVNRAPQVERPAANPDRVGPSRGSGPNRSDASGGTWQRFSGSSSESSRVLGTPASRQQSFEPSPRVQSARSESMRGGGSPARVERYGGGGGEPVRIAPPIVRERSSGGSSFGGGGGSMPRVAAPSHSGGGGGGTPHISAPMGGGGGRAGGGGGGGARGGSGGGGGHGRAR